MSGFAAAKKRKRIWTIDKSSTDNDDGDNSDDDDNDDEDYNPLEEESDSGSEADNNSDTSADKEILLDQRGMCYRHDQEMRKNDEIHGNDSSSSQTIAREESESSSLSDTHSDEASTTVENIGNGKTSSEKETRRKPWAEAETQAGKDMAEEEKPVLDGLAKRRYLQQPKGLKEESLSLEAQTDTSVKVPQEGMPQGGAKSQVWPVAQYSFNELVAAAEAYNAIRREKDAVEATLRDVQESLRDAQERYKKENGTLKELVAAIRREKDAVEASLTDVQEDLDIQRDTTNQMLVTMGWWHRRFDKVCELAEEAGVDASVLKSIRDETD